jgi:hypothetical protein
MAISINSIQRRTQPKPPRITIFGVAGIGKTSLGASAPNPVFLQTEDGLSSIDAPSFGVLRTFEEILEAIGVLAMEEHDYQTVVLDSLDWLEPQIAAYTAAQNGWANLETPGYGKGYVAALENWRLLFDGMNTLRDERAMTIIMIAHSKIVKFDAPDTEPYSRYVLKLHDRVTALVSEHSDIVAFANYRTIIAKTEAGFGKKVARGVGSGERLLHLEERPSFTAKQRYHLPDTIALDWPSLAAGIPYFNQQPHETSPITAIEQA